MCHSRHCDAITKKLAVVCESHTSIFRSGSIFVLVCGNPDFVDTRMITCSFVTSVLLVLLEDPQLRICY